MKFIVVLGLVFCSCEKPSVEPVFQKVINITRLPVKAEQVSLNETVPPTPQIIISARKQIGITTSYDPRYVSLKYPGGDVPLTTGVCTDVIIRALRDTYKMDLQKLVYEDMKGAFTKYPKIWGLSRPDRNIDHRRVPNLQCYFKRQGFKMKTGLKAEDFLPGDIVTCLVGNRPHIMIVSNRKLNKIPLVIHNIGSGTKEDNSLLSFQITGHYRIP